MCSELSLYNSPGAPPGSLLMIPRYRNIRDTFLRVPILRIIVVFWGLYCGHPIWEFTISQEPLRVWGLGFRVWGLGFGVWGLGFRI